LRVVGAVKKRHTHSLTVGSDQSQILDLAVNRLAEMEMTTTVHTLRKSLSDCWDKATLKVGKDLTYLDF